MSNRVAPSTRLWRSFGLLGLSAVFVGLLVAIGAITLVVVYVILNHGAFPSHTTPARIVTTR
jgi:hypothetical protein